MWETQVQFLDQEDPLEKAMATHLSILAWRIPWTEEPGGLQSTGSQRAGHDWETNTHTQIGGSAAKPGAFFYRMKKGINKLPIIVNFTSDVYPLTLREHFLFVTWSISISFCKEEVSSHGFLRFMASLSSFPLRLEDHGCGKVCKSSQKHASESPVPPCLVHGPSEQQVPSRWASCRCLSRRVYTWHPSPEEERPSSHQVLW